MDRIESAASDFLSHFGYSTKKITLSGLLRNVEISTVLDDSSPGTRINSYMTAGNEARSKYARGDFMAALAILEMEVSSEGSRFKSSEPKHSHYEEDKPLN